MLFLQIVGWKIETFFWIFRIWSRLTYSLFVQNFEPNINLHFILCTVHKPCKQHSKTKLNTNVRAMRLGTGMLFSVCIYVWYMCIYQYSNGADWAITNWTTKHTLIRPNNQTGRKFVPYRMSTQVLHRKLSKKLCTRPEHWTKENTKPALA